MASGNAPDYRDLTQKQQATWATGDFNIIARQIMSVSEELVSAVDPHAGERVLDVACGSGNAALVAARRWCEVTGIDLPVEPAAETPATVNDWIIQQLGRPVQGGEIVAADGVRAVVRKVRRQRVLEAQIAGKSDQLSQGIMAVPQTS